MRPPEPRLFEHDFQFAQRCIDYNRSLLKRAELAQAERDRERATCPPGPLAHVR